MDNIAHAIGEFLAELVSHGLFELCAHFNWRTCLVLVLILAAMMAGATGALYWLFALNEKQAQIPDTLKDCLDVGSMKLEAVYPYDLEGYLVARYGSTGKQETQVMVRCGGWNTVTVSTGTTGGECRIVFDENSGAPRRVFCDHNRLLFANEFNSAEAVCGVNRCACGRVNGTGFCMASD